MNELIARILKRVLLSVLVCALATCGIAASTELLLDRALGHIDLWGGLRLNVPFHSVEPTSPEGWPCVLAHEIVTDKDGQARTRWRFEGLRTYVVPRGREQWYWQPLSGVEMIFRRSSDGPVERKRHTLRERGDVIQITAPNGVCYEYIRGSLRSITSAPEKLTVMCRGTMIETLTGGSDNREILRVVFDENDRPANILVSGAIAASFYWQRELLRGWQLKNGLVYECNYSGSLLSSLSVETGQTAQIEWRRNRGWGRSDCRWQLPVQLARFRDEFYSVDVGSRGFQFKVRQGANPETNITYDPVRALVNFEGLTHNVAEHP